eukprot:scaffold15356_cov57-Phaeocystis_antarctica.AAC.2
MRERSRRGARTKGRGRAIKADTADLQIATTLQASSQGVVLQICPSAKRKFSSVACPPSQNQLEEKALFSKQNVFHSGLLLKPAHGKSPTSRSISAGKPGARICVRSLAASGFCSAATPGMVNGGGIGGFGGGWLEHPRQWLGA